MSNAREKLAQYLYEQGISEAYFDAVSDQNRPILDGERAIANAIIAALPGLVKPLEWERLIAENYMSGDYCAYHTGCAFGGKLKYAWGYGPSVRFGTETLEAAKAAAQAHHVAQIMVALGIDGEST